MAGLCHRLRRRRVLIVDAWQRVGRRVSNIQKFANRRLGGAPTLQNRGYSLEPLSNSDLYVVRRVKSATSLKQPCRVNLLLDVIGGNS